MMKSINKNSNNSKKQSKVWCMAIIANAITISVFLLLFYPRYTNTADAIMQNLLYGTIPGLQTSHLVFSNVILGKGLLLLTWWFSNVAWYTYIQYFFIFMALTGISYVILERITGSMGKVVLGIFLVFLGYEGYIAIGYVKTTCILASASFCLFLYTLIKEKSLLRIKNYFAAFLAIIASLYSFKVFLITICVCFILAGISLILMKRKTLIIRVMIGTFVIIIVSLGLYVLDCLKYKNDSYFTNTIGYRDAYEKIISFGTNVEYDEALEEAGIDSSERYKALKNGIFVNGNIETLWKINRIAAQKRAFSWNSLIMFFKTELIKLLKNGIFYLWGVLFVLCLLYIKKRVHFVLPLLLIILGGLFFMYMDYWNGNMSCFIILLPASLHLLLYSEVLNNVDPRTIVGLFVTIIVILYSIFSGNLFLSAMEDDMDIIFEDLDEEMYFLDLDSYCKSFSALTRYPLQLIPDNVYIVNGFYSTMAYYVPEYLDEFDLYYYEEYYDYRWLYNPGHYSISSLYD